MPKQKKIVDTFVSGWMDKIKAGLDYRKRFSTFDRWKDYRKMYRGQWDEGIVPVNRIFSYGRTLIPRVYFRSPRVSITATRPDLVWHAKVVEAIDNQLIRETLLKDTLKRGALDSYLCGTGPIKLGYDSEFGFLPEQVVEDDGSTATQIGRKEGDKIEYRVGVQPGMPWALRVLPEDIIVPWGTSDPNSLPWIAHYILRPLEDVKQDQKYNFKEELQGTRAPDKGGALAPQFRPKEARDKDVVFAELWEVRDLKTKRILVFCEDQCGMNSEDILQVEGLPYEFIQFNPDPEYFWAIPDCKILEPQQSELNEVRTQASRHRRIALLKFLYLRGKLKSEELEKLLSSAVGPGVAVDDTENIMSAIMLLQPHMPPELWKEAQMILQDMREELGFSSNQAGEYKGGTPPTAAEAGIVEGAFDVRVDERKDIVGDTLTRIIRKWNQWIFSFWTKEKVIQITSPEEGTPFWIQYTGDQLKGEYFLSVDAESGMPLNRVLKYQMAKDMFGMFNGDRTIDQILLRKILLQHYESVEPLAAQLISSSPDIIPQEEAAMRQPNPMGVSGAGGRERSVGLGNSPRQPIQLDQLKGK